MLYLSTDAHLGPKEIVAITRRKNQSKRRRCFVASVLFALCLGCLLDLFVLFRMKVETATYSDEAHYLNEEAVFLVRSLMRQFPSHRAGSIERNTTAEDQLDIQLPPFSREESFSGCILFLNQNHRMAEWIAYHYFALPLRTLFIAYDPKTKDRATKLIERWKNVIHFVEWEDEDYLPANWTHGFVPDLKRKASLATVTHRQRQLRFHQKCHERSVEMGVRRTLLLDPDEYLRINPKVIPPTVVNTSEPGHITKLFQQLEAPNNTFLPEQEGVTYKANCSVYPRVQFTTLGPTNLYSVPKDVDYTEPDLVDPVYYNTLRYRYRNLHRMKHPKGIVDAMDGVPHQITNLHFPLDLKCNKSAYSLKKSPLLVNHYIGSFEDFLHTYRSDARNNAVSDAGTRWKWEERSRGLGGANAFDLHLWNPLVRDESMTNWVAALFDWQSEHVAQALLRDTGMRALVSNL